MRLSCLSRLHRCLLISATALGLLLAALVPGMVLALQAAAPWDAICSASASPVTPGRSPAEPDAAHTATHCALCVLHLDSLALPQPALAALPPLWPLRWQMPAAFWDAPRTLTVWRSAQPRAPPARA